MLRFLFLMLFCGLWAGTIVSSPTQKFPNAAMEVTEVAQPPSDTMMGILQTVSVILDRPVHELATMYEEGKVLIDFIGNHRYQVLIHQETEGSVVVVLEIESM